jgi:hypothetical protein
MVHWPIAVETLRRINDELEDLACELQSLNDSFEDRLAGDRRGHIQIVLRRAGRRMEWIRQVLDEMYEHHPQADLARSDQADFRAMV